MPVKLTQEQFIARALAIHGPRYRYLHAKYERGRSPVIITCPLHGDFSQTPSNHLRGKGCPSCGARRNPLAVDVVLARFREAHGDRYDYSLMDFHTVKDQVQIICRKHGPFWQTPDNHMRGERMYEVSAYNIVFTSRIHSKGRKQAWADL